MNTLPAVIEAEQKTTTSPSELREKVVGLWLQVQEARRKMRADKSSAACLAFIKIKREYDTAVKEVRNMIRVIP